MAAVCPARSRRYAAIYRFSQHGFTTCLVMAAEMGPETHFLVTIMFSASLRNQARDAATRFIGADEGNIAVIFAIALLPVIGFVGAAIDYTRANSARSSMQSAMDSTALMLSKNLTEGSISASDIDAKAAIYFAALYNNKDATVPTIHGTYTAKDASGASTVVVTGSGYIKSDFMKVAGFPQINFGTSSTATWGNVRMRVAMALDNTGSMADDGKMPAMQTAAKALVDQLSALAKSNGDIYISIIPFAKDVNVGASNYNQSWIDWTDWDAANGQDECTKYKKNGNCKTTIWVPDDHDTWTGCVTDRDQDYDTKNTAPTTSVTRFPAEEYVSGGEKFCKPGNHPYLQPIMPLSYNWSALKTLIGNMEPTGNTNQGIGMAWAWMTLTQSDPYNAPAKDPNYTYKDAIVLLSDGLNTQNRWYGNAAQIDARQKILCDNAKAAGITIYTVHVNTGTPPDPVSAVLQYCASGPENFYVVTQANQTASVFSSIGASLTKLRVSK
jgi:Flp pilus assembly protein TadG